jgi:predicted transcriptional regulator
MRTTVDLPDDLHAVLTSLATHTRKSLSQTAVELMERGLKAQQGAGAKLAAPRVDGKTGLPVVRTARPITPEDVKALEDEA